MSKGLIRFLQVVHGSSLRYNINQTKTMDQAMKDIAKNVKESLVPREGGQTLVILKMLFPILMLLFSIRISYNQVKMFRKDDSWNNTVVYDAIMLKIDDDREARG